MLPEHDCKHSALSDVAKQPENKKTCMIIVTDDAYHDRCNNSRNDHDIL